jgi:SAM-dependent methyltransferase
MMLDTGHYWQSPYIDWTSEVPDGWDLFVVYMRESRVKARVAAVLELLSLLGPFHPVAPLSGPLADKKGVFWIALEPQFTQRSIQLFPRLGYSHAVDRAMLIEDMNAHIAETQQHARAITWHGKTYDLIRVYEEDKEFIRNRAPDMRTFLLESDNGEVRPVTGYRGNGSDLSRRGIPVSDARLLVNLVRPSAILASNSSEFLDPFAGAGGIVIEALDSGYTIFSVDIDKRLRYGLEQLGAKHYVADATQLPFDDGKFIAVATEPPYHRNAQTVVCKALAEIHRVLAPGGRLSMLVARRQAEYLLEASSACGLRLRLAAPINRKGTDVAVIAWEKSPIEDYN